MFAFPPLLEADRTVDQPFNDLRSTRPRLVLAKVSGRRLGVVSKELSDWVECSVL
jgi:hypothetical protein